jgi:predicted AlkP superfamily pyrophosphatase or phosphodiesterase
MNYVLGQQRAQLQIECLDDYADDNSEVRVIDKIIDYTDLDTMRHYNSFYSKEAKEALKRHDSRLGDIIKALKANNIYEDSTVIVLGDHSSLDGDKIINLNILLKENGYIKVDASGNITDYRAIMKTCDGSAYVYVKDALNQKLICEIRELIDDFNNEHECIEAVFTSDEAKDLGADPQCALMLEANKGYYFLDCVEGDIIKRIQPHEVGRVPDVTSSTHGYSPFKKEYTTVFMAAGCGIKKGTDIEKMNLIDEGPTMAKLLGLELKNVDGRVVEEIFE